MPKAKPKPQPRRAAAAVAVPKEENIEDESTPQFPSTSAPQSTIYKGTTLFIEDQSDTDSDAAQQTGGQRLQDSRPPEVPREGEHEVVDESEEDETAYSDYHDDPIVQSYDIIINNTFEDMMYLFQYPVRNKSQPYTLQEGFAPVEARMKVNTGVLELDIPINVDRNYDEQKGVLYGEVLHKSRLQKSLRGGTGVDGGSDRGEGPSDRRKRRRTAEDEDDDDDSAIPTPETLLDFEEAKRKNRILNRQTLGSKVQQTDANYFVGLFDEGKLKGSLQLRPQFHHIDIMTEQERANQKAMREMNNPNPPKAVEARAVNLSVKAASGDNRTLTGAEQLSKDIRLEEDEPWREIEWVDQDDDESWQMFANVHRQQPIPLNSVLTKSDYFKWCSTQVADGPDEGKGHRGHARVIK
ncbi:hypothetical protein AA313_de0207925 [Arthrobotrys entomopaga]|nr:hypothetical protein AA313_de0207925 [Arthrobotrys entomopaga]